MNQTKKNFINGIVHEALWGAGIGFFLPMTILPMALVDLGQSVSVVGFLNGLFSGGITFPQVFSALALPPRFSHPKNLAWLHAPIILGPLLAGLGFALLAPDAREARVLSLFLGFTLFAVGCGVVIPHWVAMIGRCIPEKIRGRYLGAAFFSNGLCAAGTSWLASGWVARGGMDWGYPLCFLLTVPCLITSVVILSRLKPILPAPQAPPPGALWKSFDLMNRKLREPGPFRIGLILTVLMILASAPGNLFTAFLRKEGHVDAFWFQLFSPATALGGMVGAFVLGWLVDHHGLKKAFTTAFVAGLLSLLLIYFWGNPLWPALAFTGNGIINAAFPVVALAMILKFAGHKESTVQQGLFSTLLSPWSVGAPFFCGWLAEKAGYLWAYGFAVVCCLAAFWILMGSGKLEGENRPFKSK
jgi:MFS family permease